LDGSGPEGIYKKKKVVKKKKPVVVLLANVTDNLKNDDYNNSQLNMVSP
jgi:hypothetical protein